MSERPTVLQCLESARKELDHRRTFYPLWGKNRVYTMTPERAEHEIACQEQIVLLLEKQVQIDLLNEDYWKQIGPEKRNVEPRKEFVETVDTGPHAETVNGYLFTEEAVKAAMAAVAKEQNLL